VPALPTLASLASALSEGRASAASLADEALSRARDPAGEGHVAFIGLREAEARRDAVASDERRRAGRARGPLDGLPISIKDLFDVAGEVTTAGSRVLAGRPPAARHADAVQRLADAGAVIVGRTNMTEFAYSGLGLNPHYGTPAAPWLRGERRIAGGSSSGAAVSVSDAMCAAAIGTDTGGSVRIPAAFCGLVGFKPTARRVPLGGVVPLAKSLDSVGPIARSVECCALLDALLAGDEPRPLDERAPGAITLGVARDYFFDGIEAPVAAAFERAASELAAAGFRVVDIEIRALRRLPELGKNGGIAALEAWAWHRDLVRSRSGEYDPRVVARIRMGEAFSAEDAERLVRERAALIADVEPVLRGVDAVLTATVPMAPPRFDALATDDAAYFATNGRALRNTGAINVIDGCALSLPCHREGDAPVGLMLFAAAMGDRALLATARAVERELAAGRERTLAAGR
jgi:aspartyl-tRNA(Asn)/glutamyl-tRNA(Gln) amidotransferase subunit A